MSFKTTKEVEPNGTLLHCAVLMSTLSVVQCLIELGCQMCFSSMNQLDGMILDKNDKDKELLIPNENYDKYIQEKVEIGKYISNLIIQNIRNNACP